MAAWGYEFYLLMLKVPLTHLLCSLGEILSALEDKIRIPTWPCNILYLLYKLLFMYNHKTNVILYFPLLPFSFLSSF